MDDKGTEQLLAIQPVCRAVSPCALTFVVEELYEDERFERRRTGGEGINLHAGQDFGDRPAAFGSSVMKSSMPGWTPRPWWTVSLQMSSRFVANSPADASG